MAKKIGAAAVGAAISLLFIVIARFVPNMKLTFTVLASLGTIVPMSKGYVKEACESSIAVIILGAIITTTTVLPYVLVGSFYTILTILAYQKKVKLYIQIPLKILYATLVFYVLFSLANTLVVDIDKISFLQNLSDTEIFIVFDIVFVIAFLVYDYIELKLYEYIKERLKKLNI